MTKRWYSLRLFQGNVIRRIFYESYHIVQVHSLVLHLFSHCGNVVLQHRQEDEDGDSGGEAAVIENKAAVEGAGGSAHGGAEETAHHAGPGSVSPHNGTQPGGEGGAVDVGLRGHGPGDFTAVHVTEVHGHNEKNLIPHKDGPYVSGMLSQSREGERRQDHTEGGPCKAGAGGGGDNQV